MDRGAAEKDRVAIRRRMRDELRRQRSARAQLVIDEARAEAHLIGSARGGPIMANTPRGEKGRTSRMGRSEKSAAAAESAPPASAAAPAARPKNSLRLNLMFMPPIAVAGFQFTLAPE